MRHRNYFAGESPIDDMTKGEQEKLDLAIDVIEHHIKNTHNPEEVLPSTHFIGMLRKCNIHLSEPVLLMTTGGALYAVLKKKEFNDKKHSDEIEWFEYSPVSYTGKKITEKALLWTKIPMFNYSEEITSKMTRAEEIRSASDNKLAEILCEISNHGDGDCNNCLAEEYCYPGHTGFKDWIKKEG